MPGVRRPRSIQRVRQESPGAQNLQEDVADELMTVLNTWWGQGALLQVDGSIDITFVSGVAQDIAHRLSGRHRGFVIVGLAAAAVGTIFEQTGGATASIADTHIRLQSSVNCVAKIWVWR